MEGHVSDWPCLIILRGKPIPIFTTGDRLPAKVQLDMSRLAVGADECPWLESRTGDDRLIGSFDSGPAWPPAEMLTTGYGLEAFWGVPIRGSALSGPTGAVLFLSGVTPQPTPHDLEVARLGARLAAIGFERRRAQAQITHNALHDALTDLPNRTLLLERTAQAIARSRRSGTLIALLMVDIDHFKYINDSLGHSVGDQVLVEGGSAFAPWPDLTTRLPGSGATSSLSCVTEFPTRPMSCGMRGGSSTPLYRRCTSPGTRFTSAPALGSRSRRKHPRA